MTFDGRVMCDYLHRMLNETMVTQMQMADKIVETLLKLFEIGSP